MYANSPAPMPLGETLTGTDSDGNLINSENLGRVYCFDAVQLDNTSAKTNRSGKPIMAVLLRNTSGATLYGKMLGRCTETAGKALITTVDGYTTVLANEKCVLIDEGLATNGVANNAIFWGIISGQVIGKTPMAGAEFNATGIAVGDNLVAATGSTTGATTSGRIGGYALANNTDAAGAFKQSVYKIGEALSARTSGETNSDLLINLCIRW